MVCGNSFAKTICSICYEDLKPIAEDLQAISICGHVFHELCLQQWFEYCSNAKKKNCPVCKQVCSEANAGRLYFQSVGDQSLSQKPANYEEDTGELRREIEKLLGKVSGLRSALERYQKDVKELSEELCLSKEHVNIAAALKNEAMQQKASMQQLLHLKSEDLDKKTLECMRLQERNMALAKELAAFKLASDSNLEEEEVLKFASLGNEANNKDTIVTLIKTLEFRNKSYNNLMAKCNDLGRGKARSLRKLEKKNEKIKKLKARIQELEVAVEVKDNEVLRALKASKKSTREGAILNDAKWNSNSSSINKCLDRSLEEPSKQKTILDQNGSTTSDFVYSRKIEKLKPSKDVGIANTKDDRSTIALDKGINSYYLIDEDASELSNVMHKFSNPGLKTPISDGLAVQENSLSQPEAASDTICERHRPHDNDGVSGSKSSSDCDTVTVHTSFADMDEDTVLILDDIKQVQPFINSEKKTPCEVPISQPGDVCFAGGLIGPDGTRRHLGKWCKRVQGRGSGVLSEVMQRSCTSSGNLIAVGADGRGGKIKVLKSLNQSSLDNRETSASAKRCKYGPKTSTLQSQGCLQIENFFGRAGQ
ncbi:hypothetical protein U1Q18_023679 [Sarracenia purpurea var. burkii]